MKWLRFAHQGQIGFGVLNLNFRFFLPSVFVVKLSGAGFEDGFGGGTTASRGADGDDRPVLAEVLHLLAEDLQGNVPGALHMSGIEFHAGPDVYDLRSFADQPAVIHRRCG